MNGHLTDIDELLEKIINHKSKIYFTEAVYNYYNSLYRSSLISLWLSVMYDIFYKINLLSLESNDKAKLFIEKYIKAMTEGEYNSVQEIERDLLNNALEFEIISRQEKEFFERLKNDRNKCAHLHLNDEEELFTPSAEQVRYYLKQSTESLLKYPKIYGPKKVAIFFDNLKDSTIILDNEELLDLYLKKQFSLAKDSFKRNFCLLLLKNIFYDSTENNDSYKYLKILSSTNKITPEIVPQILKEKSFDLATASQPNKVWALCLLIIKVPDILSIDDGLIIKLIKTYIEKTELVFFDISFELFGELSKIKHFETDILKNINSFLAKDEHVVKLISQYPNELFSTKLVDIFSRSPSFDLSNYYFSILEKYSNLFKKDDILRIIDYIQRKPQIKSAFDKVPTIEKIVTLRKTLMLQDEKEAWLDLASNDDNFGFIKDLLS